MALVLTENHHNLVYVLFVVLYSMVSLNFYLTYQLNKQCNKKVECFHQNCKLEKQIKLTSDLKNEETIRSETKDVKFESTEEHIQRNKRQLNERFGFVDDFNTNNDSLHQIYDEYNSGAETPHPSHHSHRLRHRKRVKSRSAANQEDNSGPVVEFFPKPQPTQETPGYVWLTSYSRIPVST